ncbi:MAG: hypothetical protein GY851_27305, partial [bacterium]|nr:hypothetical protein [bacterium]
DLASHVDEAINALPERLRTPLLAHFFEGQTHEAVAESLGMPRGTVTYRINRGVHLVRRSLRRRGVIVGATAFAAWMQAQAAEAAPVAVVEGLTKMAIAGGGAAVVKGAAGAGTGFLALKLAAVSVSVVAAISAGGWLLTQSFTAKSVSGITPGAPTPANSTTRSPAEPGETLPPGASGPAPSLTPAVATSTARPASDDATTSGALITGRVLEATGEPATLKEDEDGVREDSSSHVRFMGRRVGSIGIRAEADGSFAFERRRTVVPGAKGYLIADWGDDISSPLEVEIPEVGLHGVELRLQPGARVSGVFQDRDGKPIVGMNVNAVLLPEAYSASAVTDAQGRFEIAPLPPGEYAITASSRGLGQAEAPRVSLRLAAGGHATGVRLVYDAVAYAIAGRVTSASGEVLEHVCVFLNSVPGATSLARTAHCSDEGRFSFYVPPGVYTLRIDRSGYLAFQLDRVEAGSDALQIRLMPARALTGHVIHADTGAPITNYGLSASVPFESNGQTFNSGHGPSTVKDEQGAFEMDISRGGEVTLIAKAPGFEPGHAVVPNFDPQRGASGVTIRLSPGKPLRGQVLTADGRPVPQAHVVEDHGAPIHLGHLKHSAIAETDEEGRFLLSTLPPEAVDLVVYCPGYPPATTTAPRADRRGELLIVRLPKGGHIEGTVTIGAQPVPGQEVRASVQLGSRRGDSRFWGGEYKASTDADGRYRITGLLEGPFRVNLQSEFSESREADVAEGKATVVDFALVAREASLQGCVFEGGKAKQAGVSLSVWGEDGQKRGHGSGSKPDGTFLFEEAPAGPAEVSATLQGDPLRVRCVPVDLKPGDSNRVDVHFVVGDAVIEGTAALGEVRSVSMYGEWETAAGVETLTFRNMGDTGEGFHYEGVPSGRGELRLRYSTDAGQYTRYLALETASGRVTQVDLVAGSGTLNVGVSDAVVGWAMGLMILPSDVAVPDLRELTMNEIERLPNVFVSDSRGLMDGALAIPGLEAGEYTVIALGWAAVLDSEDETIPDLQYKTATVRLEPGATAEVGL